MKAAPVFYRCDGCGRPIKATSDDPVHRPGSLTLCTKCMCKDSNTIRHRPSERAQAAKNRWANMSPSERRARITKMQAGRKARDDDS